MKSKKFKSYLFIEYYMDAIPCVSIKNLMPKKLHKEFEAWMEGQTCALVNDEVCVYASDLSKFLKWKRGGPEPYWD